MTTKIYLLQFSRSRGKNISKQPWHKNNGMLIWAAIVVQYPLNIVSEYETSLKVKHSPQKINNAMIKSLYENDFSVNIL